MVQTPDNKRLMRIMTEEHKNKIRQSNLGKKRSKETRLRMSLSRIGKKLSESQKSKLKGRIPWNKGKINVYSKEALERMSKARIGVKPIHKENCDCHLCGGDRSYKVKPNKGNFKKGKEHPNWNGGISVENLRIRNIYRSELRRWRKNILIRDNFTCCMCHKIGGKLFSHHIKRFIDNIELRLDVDNGITLCEPCHILTLKKETMFEEYFYSLLYFNGEGIS